MARFRYRMQNILNVKEKLETQAKNEFAVASAKVREEEEKLAGLIHRREEYEELLRRLSEGVLDVRKIAEARNAIESLKDLIENQRINVKQAEKILEEKRIALQAAVQDVKTHEKLKEKQFEQFLQDEAANESKEIDELVSYRFGQKE